ncbi:MAG: hypothetical protein V2A79_14735 [Planctomycetota bacterium]
MAESKKQGEIEVQKGLPGEWSETRSADVLVQRVAEIVAEAFEGYVKERGQWQQCAHLTRAAKALRALTEGAAPCR